MQYFVWGTDRPDSKARRMAVMERHWDFIARYDDRLIARGPVLDSADPQRVLGSIHIVELDDADAATEFAYDEPFAVDGVFAEIVMMPFRLELGRTQFDFEGTPDHPRFFIHCPAAHGVDAVPEDVAAAHETYCREFDPHLVCRGSLLTDDGAWAGRVFFVEMPDRAAAESFLAGDPCATAGLYDAPHIHRWTMGGAANIKAAGLMK
tara:strand:- start:943 stop:1563 length:621 start_codon:yes stop_codon:yes gene_type:complete